MIEPPVDATTEPVARARRFAALSGPFDPRVLRDVIGAVSSDVALAVASDLADVCDTDQPGGKWLMRGTARQREINGLINSGLLSEAMEWRRSMTMGDPTADAATIDLLDALGGSAHNAPPTSQAAADGYHVETLKRIAVALDRAGQRAPAHESLDLVRSALGRKDADERSEAMLKDGFFGRTAELAKIARWLERPFSTRPVRALFISGLPGIGKSTLIDASVRQAKAAVPPWIVVRLDFDRSGLDVQDLVGLTIEVTRQVSIALGDAAPALRQARLVAAGGTSSPDPDVKGDRREHIPDDLARAMAAAVAASGSRILVILDTLEVLSGRAQTHPERLFDCLDELCDRGLRPMAIIAAGRGDALESVEKSRVQWRITLTGLDTPSAEAMLNRLNAPAESHAEILEIAEGNPLVLRLAAQVVQEAGPEALDSVRRRQGLRAAFLYRVLLSRVGDPTLQKLAEPGLVVRRINPDVIAQVLAPVLLRHRLDPQVAVQVFDRLSSNHWLVEPDSIAGWVRHRSDIRRVLLRLMYEGERAAAAARIDRKAATWFDHRTEAFAPMEAAYHRLQATRRGDDMPSIDPEVLQQFDAATIAELPQPAQDYVRSMRGERTSQFRAKAKQPAVGPLELEAAAKELEAILERGDIIEAGYVYDRALAGQKLDPKTPISEISRAYLWRAGRWHAASSDLPKARPVSADGESDLVRTAVVALTRLEMAAELDFASFVQALATDRSLLSHAVDLRMKGIKGSIGDGALGFAIHQAGGPVSTPSWSLFDPIQAAETVWMGEPGNERVIDVLSVPQGQLAARVLPNELQVLSQAPPPTRAVDPRDPAGAARLLAGMSPYASVAEAVRSRDAGRVGRHLASVDFAVAAEGGLPPSNAGPWSIAPAVSPEGSIDSLARLGLLGEWLGAAAFVLRHPDLRLIAQSAERWRRTTAGDWAYLTSFEATGPQWSRQPDATLADRIEQLERAEDPAAASRAQLAIWWGVEEPSGDVETAIDRRMPGAVKAAREAARESEPPFAASQAANALQKRNLPAAFIPAMAVLISLDERKGSRSR